MDQEESVPDPPKKRRSDLLKRIYSASRRVVSRIPNWGLFLVTIALILLEPISGLVWNTFYLPLWQSYTGDYYLSDFHSPAQSMSFITQTLELFAPRLGISTA